jgi:dCMP deaminase
VRDRERRRPAKPVDRGGLQRLPARTVHAEQNAIADAARRGSSVEGAVAYVTHYPCINCAKILAASGIAEIRYREDYCNDPFVEPLLADANVKVLKL